MAELRQPTIQEVTQLVEGITKSITATVNDFDKPGIEKFYSNSNQR